MQLIIEVHSVQDIVLPINYHHIQQSAIFALSGEQYGKNAPIHDGGSEYQKRVYKLFTFGAFNGAYSVKNKMIAFHNGFWFEVRSADESMIENIAKNITEHGLRLGDVSYHDVSVKKMDTHIQADEVKIMMVSPICVHTTLDNGYTKYWNPTDEEFYEAVAENFRRKYEAATGEAPESSIKLEMERVTQKDKYFTKYKNIYIEAWKGVYTLSGNAEYLDFLYNCGLGARNSQGFGMFKVIE